MHDTCHCHRQCTIGFVGHRKLVCLLNKRKQETVNMLKVAFFEYFWFWHIPSLPWSSWNSGKWLKETRRPLGYSRQSPCSSFIPAKNPINYQNCIFFLSWKVVLHNSNNTLEARIQHTKSAAVWYSLPPIHLHWIFEKSSSTSSSILN